MPRRQYKHRTASVDPMYRSYELSKFVNYIMIDGKKSVAQRVIYDMMEALKKEENDSMVTLSKAITNVTPDREVRPRRLGGASYLVPTEVRKDRKLYLALNWIIEAAKTRSNKEFHSFAAKLSAEISEAAKNQGQAVAKRQQAEKIADQNKAFAHLKW